MIPIEVNTATSDLNDQLDFLIKHEFYVRFYKYRKLSVYLLILTIITIAIVALTEANSLIILKVVSISITSIAWFAALIIFVMIIIGDTKEMLGK